MKKLLVTLLAAVFLSGAFAQSSFPDIPANHWAGDAVDRIADLGIVIGFPDGTFRGNEAFTRYQAALVVSR
ncbi:MAG TPA: S-layer homology domain-containing protein, partial [Trueperaceae bacterium]|nr:S-layer homology domain-containing protein [Trueperaceae bacterium]